MICKRLLLKKIRSFVDGEVGFFDGFQCIVGGVGAGKTTILLAIDFALFGRPLFGPTRGFGYLLRSGANSGSVELEFEHGNKTYKIVRGLQRRGRSVVEDVDALALYENDRSIARMKKSAVEEEITNAIGVDYGLFREILWVQQERLKEILDLTPSRRRDRVDGILGLSDFEIAWERMREYEKHYEKQISRIKEEDPYIPLIDQQRKLYDDLAKKLIDAEADVRKLEARREGIEADIKKLEGVLKELTELEEKLERWERDRYEVEVEIRSNERDLGELDKRIKSREEELIKYAKEVAELEHEMEKSWRDLSKLGVDVDLGIKKVRDFLRSFETKRNRVEAKKDFEKELIKELKDKLNDIGNRKRCPTCLQEIAPSYRKNISTDLTGKIAASEKKVQSYEGDLLEISKMAEEVGSIYEALKEGQEKHSTLERQIALLKGDLDRDKKTRLSIKTWLDRSRKKLVSLDAKKPEFDPKLVVKVRTEKEGLSNQVATIESKLEHVKVAKSGLVSEMDEVRARLDRAEKDKQQVERSERILDFVREFRELYRRVQPVLRKEYVQWLEGLIEGVLFDVRGGEEPIEVELDEESYTPIVSVGRGEPLILLSGGERTQLALAYKVGLSQLVMDTRGRELDVLIIDEPTASLGREDMSIMQLAGAISRLRGIRQIIAVTHSDDFADQAEHVIEITKTYAGSQVRVVK